MTSLKRRFAMSSVTLATFVLAGTTGLCAEDTSSIDSTNQTMKQGGDSVASEAKWSETRQQPAHAPAVESKLDLDEAAKLLTKAVGGRWSVKKRERAPGLGPELGGTGFPSWGSNVPYFVLPFPLDDTGKEKLALFRRWCNAPVVVLGSSDRCTVLAGDSHDPKSSTKILQTLGVTAGNAVQTMRQGRDAVAPESKWSETAGGLQYRLYVAPHDAAKTKAVDALTFEVRNVTNKPIEIETFNGKTPWLDVRIMGYRELMTPPVFATVRREPLALQPGKTWNSKVSDG